jgi:hypothetical protein
MKRFPNLKIKFEHARILCINGFQVEHKKETKKMNSSISIERFPNLNINFEHDQILCMNVFDKNHERFLI